MKYTSIIFLIMICFLLTNFCHAQEIVTVLKEQSYRLNPTVGELVGGNSTLVIPIEIPPRTVSWHYAVTAYTTKQEREERKKAINLAVQLSSLLGAGSLTKVAIKTVTLPPGDDFIDAFLFTSKEESEKFKDFLSQEAFHYQGEYSRENIQSGLVSIGVPEKHGRKVFIGLRNVGALSGITVTIEVVAEVNNNWDSAERNTINEYLLKVLPTFSALAHVNQQELKSLAGCYGEYLTENYTLAELQKLDDRQFKKLTVEYITNCIEKLDIYLNVWTEDYRNKIYRNCYNGFSPKPEGVESICKCVEKEITDKYEAYTFLNLSSERKSEIVNTTKQSCYQKTGNTNLESNSNKIQELKKEIRGLEIVKDYTVLVTKYEQLIDLGITDAGTYNAAARNCLLSKQLEKTKGYLAKGLSEDSYNLYLHVNLAHYFLLNGEYRNAEEIYLKYKDYKMTPERSFRRTVSEDFELFESLRIYHEDFERIRASLKLTK